MSLPLIFRVLFLLLFLISMCKSNQIRNVKVIQNVQFKNKKITEMPTKTHVVRSKIECIVECKNTPSCLSFLFNGDLKNCYLYDRDFVDATVTSTTDEIGWNYFYVLPGLSFTIKYLCGICGKLELPSVVFVLI